MSETARIGPRHRLEICADAVFAGEVAERREAIDQAGLVGIVAGDERLAGAEARAAFERCAVVRNDGVRLQPKDFDVEHRHCRVGDAPRGLARERRVADDRVLHFLCGRRQHAQADLIETRLAGARHHVGRRQLENGERGERDRMRHGDSQVDVTASRASTRCAGRSMSTPAR
jgi:hypothetical protein